MISLDEDYMFPFRDLEEDDFFVCGNACQGGQLSSTNVENMTFKTFEYAEHKMYDPEVILTQTIISTTTKTLLLVSTTLMTNSI